MLSNFRVISLFLQAFLTWLFANMVISSNLLGSIMRFNSYMRVILLFIVSWYLLKVTIAPKKVLFLFPYVVYIFFVMTCCPCSLFYYFYTFRLYQEAIRASGYEHKLNFNQNCDNNRKRKRRRRNVSYFNAPFCKSVATRVGKCFLSIVDKNFT